MDSNYLYNRYEQKIQYLLELNDAYRHHIWLINLKSKPPSVDFFNNIFQIHRSSNYVDSDSLKFEIVSTYEDKTILTRFVMVEKLSSKKNYDDGIDPLIKWSFQCAFFNSFLHNVKNFRLTEIADSKQKSWDLHLCALAHSTLWDNNSAFLGYNTNKIIGVILCLNPSYITNSDI
jgi:hypothetical protein